MQEPMWSSGMNTTIRSCCCANVILRMHGHVVSIVQQFTSCMQARAQNRR